LVAAGEISACSQLPANYLLPKTPRRSALDDVLWRPSVDLNRGVTDRRRPRVSRPKATSFYASTEVLWLFFNYFSALQNIGIRGCAPLENRSKLRHAVVTSPSLPASWSRSAQAGLRQPSYPGESGSMSGAHLFSEDDTAYEQFKTLFHYLWRFLSDASVGLGEKVSTIVVLAVIVLLALILFQGVMPIIRRVTRSGEAERNALTAQAHAGDTNIQLLLNGHQDLGSSSLYETDGELLIGRWQGILSSLEYSHVRLHCDMNVLRCGAGDIHGVLLYTVQHVMQGSSQEIAKGADTQQPGSHSFEVSTSTWNAVFSRHVHARIQRKGPSDEMREHPEYLLQGRLVPDRPPHMRIRITRKDDPQFGFGGELAKR